MSTALKIVKKYFPEVKKIVDAGRPLKVQVSEKDVKGASSKDPTECAVAKSLQKQHTGALVSNTVTYIIDGDQARRFMTPLSVEKEIVSFDRSHVFAPGEYKLRPPSKHERLGPRERPQYEKNRKVEEKRTYHKTLGIRSIIESKKRKAK